MKFKIFILVFLLLISVGTASADQWRSNSSIVSGLVDVGTDSTPTVFNDSGTWKLITGEYLDDVYQGGLFTGYYWSGSTWTEDSNIVAGLSNYIIRSAPEVFYDAGTWKLISGRHEGTFVGYQWSGSTWVENSTLVAGLGDVGSYSKSTVFNDSGTWKLITGNFGGSFYGYQWNTSTSQWDSNSTLVTGLASTTGGDSAPEVFYDSGIWKLITGKQYHTTGTNDYDGYQWNTSTSKWDSNSSIVNGLTDAIWGSKPTVYNDLGVWKLISGHDGGSFIGYQWNIAPITSNLMTEHVTNHSQIYTNTSTPYFNWTYTDAESDTQHSWEIQVGTASGLSDMWATGQLLGTDINDIYAGSGLTRNVTYYIQVRTNDGTEDSDWELGTFKLNALPTVNNITITPGAPLDTDDLVVNNDTAIDGNGDPTTVYYKWYKDNVHQPALNDVITVNSSNLTDGEVWKVGVIPNDTYENGTEVISATVTIGSLNHAPTMTDITTNVSTKKYGYDVLVSTIDAYDDDDDNYVFHVGTGAGLSDLCNSSSTPNGTEANCSFTVPWTSGIHTLYGRLTDANDTSSEENVIFTVDVTPPILGVNSIASSSITTDETNLITANVTVVNGSVSWVKVKVRNNVLVSTNYTMTGSNGTWTYTYSPGGAGNYLVTHFYASDDSGNVMTETVSHAFEAVTGAAGGSPGGGAAPNITVVGDLTLTPDVKDTYFFYTAVGGDQTGVYKFIANRNLETCRVDPNSDATCEIIDGYIVEVTLIVNETINSYDGTVTVTDANDYTTSSRLVVRIVKLFGALPIGEYYVGPFAELLSLFFETSENFIIGIKTWFVVSVIGLFGFTIVKAQTA